jgi:hypothetical protein
MANYLYNLRLKYINSEEISINNYAVTSIELYLTDLDSKPVTLPLDKLNFSIIAADKIFTDFNVQLIDSSYWLITINSGHELPVMDNYALIQISTLEGKSNKLYLSFAKSFHNDQATFDFKTMEPGKYILSADRLNDLDFSSVKSDPFTIQDSKFRPTTQNSSILVKNGHLVHFSNDPLTVTLTLNNETNDANLGPYEICLYAKI